MGSNSKIGKAIAATSATPEAIGANLRELFVYLAGYRLEHLMKAERAASRGRGKRKDTQAIDRLSYDAAVNHAIGIGSEHFLQRLKNAADHCDAEAFAAFAQAFAHVSNYERKANKINIHVRSALTGFILLDEELDRFPTRWEVREWVSEKIDDPYEEESDWSYVWKESDLEFLAVGESKPPTVKRLRRF